MNTNTNNNDDAPSLVERQAIYWVERTEAPDFNDEEGLAFQEWLEASTHHQAAYEHYLNAISALRAADESQEPEHEETASGRGSRWLELSGMAAALMLSVGIGLWAFLQDRPQELIYATAVGQQRSVTLEDGTVVTLNTNSEIKVTYSRNLRRVDLVRGQSEFDIARDKNRPFQTYTDDGMIMALGTIYDVRRVGNETIFTLIEGSAIVGDLEEAERWKRWQLVQEERLPRDVVMLEPGEQVKAVAARSLSSVTSTNIDHIGLWKTGVVVMNSTPLKAAFAEMNRYSKIKLTLANDSALQELTISGRYDVGDPESFAENLSYAFPVEVVPVTDTEIRIELRSENVQ